MGKHHVVVDEEVWDELQRLKLDYKLNSTNQVIRKLIYEKGFGMPRYKEELEEMDKDLEEIKKLVKKLPKKVNERREG